MIAPLRALAVIAALVLLIVPSAAITVTAEPIGTTLETLTEKGVTVFSYDASPEGNAIQRIGIDAPTGTLVSFTLTYGSGSTASGTLHYYNDGFYRQTSDITLGGESSSYTYVGLQEIGRFYVSGYGRNESEPGVWEKGFLVFGSTAGLSTISNDFVFLPVSGDPVIYKIDVSSNNPVDVAIYYAPRDDVAAATEKSFLDVANEWVQFATGIATTIYGVLTSAFRWIKFFFIDNLGMTISLYIAGSLAIAARRSRGNPITVLRQFFRDQKNLFEFIMSLWERLVNIIAKFRGIFRI